MKRQRGEFDALIISIVAGVGALLLLMIPVLNKRVFKTINVDEIVMEGREGIKRVQELQADGKFQLAIDSANALIDRYTQDSLTFFVPDITSWDTIRAIVTGDRPHRWAHLIVADLDAADVEPLKVEGTPVEQALRNRVVKSLNEAKEYVNFLVSIQDSGLDLQSDRDVARALTATKQAGVLTGAIGDLRVKDELTAADRALLQRLQFLVIERLIFPEFVRKEPKRGSDWASEFIVQTAMFNIGVSYKAQFQLDRAISVWNSLIDRYPESIYAEVLFLEIGKALLSEGKKLLADRNLKEADYRFHEAVSYLEKIERNREVAERFPKYKYVDLEPGAYVNVDQASRAKSQVKEKTSVYTQEKAEQELSGKEDDSRSGYFLEDAVKLIGECYIQIGQTDSARMQFRLLLDFFPESDNLDDAQKLIAESYMREADLLLATQDSTDPAVKRKASELYELAVKEFLKFANVYPQSELISENFIALGDAYNKLGRPKDAQDAFQSALGRAKEAEEMAKVQLQIGNYFYERDRYPEAISAYQIILKNLLSTQVASNAQYMLGQCYNAKGDTTEALKNFQVILDHYKNSNFLASAALEIGNWHYNRGNWKDAKTAYGHYIYDEQSNLAPRMMFQLGMIWRKIGDTQEGAARNQNYKEAIQAFRKVVDAYIGKAPEADQASYQIAELYKAMGNIKAAREATKNIQAPDVRVRGMKLFRDEGEDSHEADKNYWQEIVKESQDPEEEAAARYELAMVHAAKPDEYEKALAEFEKVLELTAKNSRKINARVGIARIYSGQQKFGEAEALLDSLIENPKVSKELQEQLQIQFYDAQYRGGKVDEALEGFEKFVAEMPNHKQAPLAYFRIGSILAERKKHAEAQETFQVILDKYPEAVDMIDRATLSIGEQMAAQGKPKQAAAYLEKYMADHPDAIIADNIWMKIAGMYERDLNQPDKAISRYGEILKGDDSSSALFSHAAYRRGALLNKADKLAQAEKAFELVRKEHKAVYRGAQSEIGKILVKRGKPMEAIKRYEEIVQAAESPEDTAIARIGIGDVYSELKKSREAAKRFVEVYTTYTGTDTSLITGALVKGISELINSKQYSTAIKYANEMQKKYPDHQLTVNTYYFEATAYFQKKQYKSARNVFAQIIKSGKSKQLTEIAYYQTGDTYYFGKDYTAAVAAYGKYLKRYPKGQFAPRALYMQGICFVTEQKWKSAKAKLYTVVNKYPKFGDLCTAKNYLAYSLNKLDEWETALKYYKQVKNGRCNKAAREMAEKEYEDIVTQRM